MTTTVQTTVISFSEIPAIGTEIHAGTFAGITSTKDDLHHAVVLLHETAKKLTWKKAMNWAKKQDAELPSRAVAALLFANLKDKRPNGWHWTSEEDDASSAWLCNFHRGYQLSYHKSCECGVVAVRLIRLTA